MGSHRNPQSTQDVDKTVGCSQPIDLRIPLLTGTPKQLAEYGKVQLVAKLSHYPYVLMSLLWTCPLQAT